MGVVQRGSAAVSTRWGQGIIVPHSPAIVVVVIAILSIRRWSTTTIGTDIAAIVVGVVVSVVMAVMTQTATSIRG